MQQGDKVTKKGKDWLGTVMWVDVVEKKVGVVFNSPALYAGGSNTYSVDELEVVGDAKAENDIYAKMDVGELRLEIDKLRKDRSERLARPVSRKVYGKKEPSELHQLAEMIAKHGVERVKEALKGGD